MNEQKIAALEDLLGRVRSRAKGPHVTFASLSGHAAQPSDAAASAPILRKPTTAPPPSAPIPEPEPSTIEVSSSELAEAEYSDVEMEVEVSTEVVDVDVDDLDVEAIQPRSEMESGAQRVAAHAREEEAPELMPEPEPLAAAHEGAPANELEEEPPVSSRRAVGGEPPVDAYASAPRHTPPPESGKQMASAAPAGRISSIPARAEGEGLVGGWREPGLASEPPREQGGMASWSPRASVPAASANVAGTPEASAPQIIDPVVPSAPRVASIVSAAPAFTPSSFGELLDATLGL